ncbi:penicillin-binding protein 1C [Candidatus Endoriftia persephone]|jgi:penicillin-binding protein 1C|uniref:peptidoglycan glycosyltransferase n=3 Tax=Gammaproteobacteria TaxID=1236 RepID=A0A9J7A081_9GAMM|nr:penicillin-binding protein 1C [Candidatus Endoriftia persephone]USF88394.1 penicillin-binding protein 1C [Candidatus Endoriftia persephone]
MRGCGSRPWLAWSAGLLLASGLLLWALDLFYPLQLLGTDAPSQVVVDRQGRPLRTFPNARGVWRYPLHMEQISPLYIEALLGYEDRWFYWHPGINPFALLRAATQNLASGRIVSGGSTLTMQVARLLHPHPRSLSGKLSQILRALQLEWHFSKREILELYLQLAPFGGPLEGVQAASLSYLQKDASELTHAEAALLAVLPQAPSRLRPDRHAEPAEAARNKVLERLASQGIWSQAVVQQAKLERVYANSFRPPLLAPLLARRLRNRFPQQAVIRTTLDGELQAMIAELAKNYAQQQPPGVSVALLVVENRSAEVLAYVGSAGFLDDKRLGQVDMVRAIRSPGSTLKPFLYGMALDDGLIHSASLLSDAPRHRQAYRPANFHRGHEGPVNASRALQQSLNVPAVNLLEQLGPGSFANRLANAGLGLTIPGDGRPNPALILGGAGISLERLLQGYLAIANNGQTQPLHLLLGEPDTTRFLLSPGAAWIVRQILAETPRPDRLGGHRVRDETRLAWKTGTSYGFRDAWAVGVTPRYSLGVWLGRPDGTPVPGHYGALSAAPLLFRLANLQADGNEAWSSAPPSVAEVQICWPLGTLKQQQPEQHCHRNLTAWSLDGQIPPTPNQGLDSNPLKLWVSQDQGKRIASSCPGVEKQPLQLALWPPALEPWLPFRQTRLGQLPAADSRCPPASMIGAAGLQIISPNHQAELTQPGGDALPQIMLKSLGAQGKVSWYVNGEFLGRFPASQDIAYRFSQAGKNRILALDEQGNNDQVEVEILIGE